MEFTYSEGYAGQPVATVFPVREKRFGVSGSNLHPYFANLLPEGARLSALLRAVKTSKDDLLSLLAVVGRDAVGYVSVTPRGSPPRKGAPNPQVADRASLTQTSFAELFRQSVDYQNTGYDPTTVAGVQEKLSASMISFPLGTVLSQGESQAAYILKLSPAAYPYLVENEAFFMRAARQAGIEVAEVEVVRDCDGHAGLLVKRFDRVLRRGGRKPSLKLRQEDACQLLDRYPADKYAVSLRDVIEKLNVCDSPIVETAKLMRLYAFSYVIGNGDLHAKNISVYFPPKGPVRLTPAYDLLSTFPYGDTRMALQLDGRDTRFTRPMLVSFAARFHVRETITNRLLDEVCDGIPSWIADLEEIGLDAKKTRALRAEIESRRDRLV